MSKKKRWLRKRLIMLAFFLCLFGCTKSQSFYAPVVDDDPAAEITLTFYGNKYEPVNVEAIEHALHAYMEQHKDISISYESTKGRDYYDALSKRLANDWGDDIFMVDQATLRSFEKQGYLADLSNIATIDNFSDLVKKQMMQNGHVYYIPTSISSFGLYCNEALLQQHGQKIPQNLAEFMAVCDYFVKQGITPIVANNDISLKTIVIAKGMYPIYQQSDSTLSMEQFNQGEKDLAAQLAPGFALVEEMIQKGYVNAEEALQVEKTKDDLVLFAKGEQPFMLSGTWAAQRLRELKPTFSFSIHPYPILDDGNVMVMNVDTRLSVNAFSEHVEEAKNFIKFFSQEDVMWEFVNSQSSFSPLKDARLSDDEAIQSMKPYLSNGRSVIGADDHLIYPIWNLSREGIEKLLKGVPAETVVQQLQEELLKIRVEAAYEK